MFPSSWYPDTTPNDVQRWTAPSCESCNGRFGELEKELLVFLACCINPTKPAAQGLYERVRRTMGIGVEGLNDDEKRHREARRRKLLNEARPYSPEVQPHIIPGLGPHPEAPVSSQMQLTIKAEDIHAVVKKIVRGCEYWLAAGRIVEPPYEIEVFFPTETPELVGQLLTAFALGPVYLGPGLRIRRGGAHDDSLSSLYELVMWDTLTVYASILPPATERVISHEEIALHAYYHWERRGRPFGSPEVDWYWAIEDLKRVPLRVGVLIIGSLYWRGRGRDRWRCWRLDMNRKWLVKAPIQYGRRSNNGTFTMVFSELPDDHLGQAIVVACQREVSSPADLIAEAEWLWSAEDNRVPSVSALPPTQSISAEWGGCVALLRNPESNVPQELLDSWAERVLREQHYNANVRRRVDSRGTLLIDWPHLTEGGLAPLDLLLATSNDPAPTYPTVQEIADAWNREPDNERRAEYFRRNRENGIYTFQDPAIEERLH